MACSTPPYCVCVAIDESHRRAGSYAYEVLTPLPYSMYVRCPYSSYPMSLTWSGCFRLRFASVLRTALRAPYASLTRKTDR